MQTASTMRASRIVAGSQSTRTMTAKRNVLATPGSAQLLGCSGFNGRVGSLSAGSRRVQQATYSAGVAHPGEEREGAGTFHLNLSVPTTGMAKGLGSSGRGATMERSKLSTNQKQASSAPKLDDGMGGGGIGKGIFNGGGGDGGDGDDDDYFNEFGDGDGEGEGDGFFRRVFDELYDAKAIAAVLQEWYKTMADLPLILRQAAQMGLFSSAALVRFMSMDVRPNVTRFVTRSLPAPVSREVVGRLMADPAFMQKMMLEQMITISCSLVYEARVRGDNFWKELDLVALNTLTLAAANAAVIYLVAPTRAAPAPARHEWQNMLAKLPNNVFEGTTPLKAYSTNSRVASLFVKTAELCGVGMLAGAAQSALAQAAVAVRKASDPAFEPSMPVPSVKQSALGLGASLGIFANLRYQTISGFDRYLFDHANFLWSYLTLSGLLRTASTFIGDQTRVYLQGLPAPAPVAVASSSASASAASTQQRQRQLTEAQRRMIQQRYMQLRHQQHAAATTTTATSGEGSTTTTATATKTGKKKRRSTKRPQAGFEMGVGPAPVAA